TAGTVRGNGGHDFFWFATVWSSTGVLVARVNVVDLQADRVVLSKEYTKLAAPSARQTQIEVDGFGLGWQPGAALGRWAIDAPVGGHGALLLTLTPLQPYVLNGPNGIVEEGRGASSAYYSDPRLAARGTLVVSGRST